jgi:hypothetical protein
MESHIAELQRRHAALDREIHDALAHPSVDEVQMTELKRKKLALKEQIERLKAPMSVH